MDDHLTPQETPNATPPPLSGAPATPPIPPLLPPLPPPIISAPAPQKPARSRAWKFVALAALVLLAFCFLGYFTSRSMHFLAPGKTHVAYGLNSDGEHRLEEVYVERKDTDDKIAIVEVEGIITGRDLDRSGAGMVEFISQQLKAAAKDTDVKAIILKINSPGGEVLAADEISRAIAKFQETTDRPVIASMGSLAASGGYYVAAPCRWIVANELTITGSIGVIMHGYNYRGLMDKVGILPQTYKSGKFKDMLSGEKEPNLDKLPPEERDTRLEEQRMVNALIMETYAKFKDVVETGRNAASEANRPEGRTLVNNWTNYADGRVFSGKQAKELGFVDELGDLEAAIKRAKKLADIKTASIIQYREPFNIGSLFNIFGKSEATAVKIDLGFDAPKLKAGYLYYITPTVLF